MGRGEETVLRDLAVHSVIRSCAADQLSQDALGRAVYPNTLFPQGLMTMHSSLVMLKAHVPIGVRPIDKLIASAHACAS